MNKLLASNFFRLRKNRLFWEEAALMFAFGIFLVGRKYYERLRYQGVVRLDDGFFAYALVIGVVMAVFGGAYLGTEYSDGTLRNKLIVGHSRAKIYFADLLTNVAVSLLMCICFLVPAAALGIPLLGALSIDVKLLLWILAGTAVLAAAFSAIFTLLGMLYEYKSAVAGLLLVLAFFITAGVIQVRLNAQEYTTFYTLAESGGLEEHTEPNPKYLTGMEREVYQFLYDVIPAGQAIQYVGMSAVHLWQMPLYSLIIIAGTTAVGVGKFRKKDIK